MRNVIVYGNNFWPEPIGIPKYTADMVRFGCEDYDGDLDISVICTKPYYPNWEKWPGYNYLTFSKETYFDASILRCPTLVPKSSTSLSRVFQELVFAAFSFLPVIIRYVKGAAIVVTVPSLLNLWVCYLPRSNRKVFVIVKDLQLQIVERNNLIKNRRLLNLVKKFEKRAFKRCHSVYAVSNGIIRELNEQYELNNVNLFPDWVNLSGGTLSVPAMKAEIFTIGYSGNIAKKQNLKFLLDVAHWCRELPVQFVIAGSGPELNSLIEYCSKLELTNVRFDGLCSEAALPERLKSFDLHVVPQLEEFSDLCMPGKIFNVMACERALLVFAPDGSELEQVIKESGSGVCLNTFDLQATASVIVKAMEDPSLLSEFGASGKRYVEKNYSRDRLLRNFWQQVEEDKQ